MINFSYMISVPLRETIEAIDRQRVQILTTPLSQTLEIKFRFEAQINRAYWSLALSHIPLAKQDVEDFLTNEIPVITTYPSRKRKLDDAHLALFHYKQGLDYISREWYVNPAPVSLATAMTLSHFARTRTFRIPEEELMHLFEYLKTSSDHPVIQAAFVQMQIMCMEPFEEGNGRLSRLLTLLYLYKFGYDFRGLLVLEDYWRRDVAAFRLVKDKVLDSKSLTIWLEYFAQAVSGQLEKALQKIKAHEFAPAQRGIWDLSDRQKAILQLLENPKLTLTNRRVQKMYKVSQVTASRDLTKLATLGLIRSHGKGRSVTYSRV